MLSEPKLETKISPPSGFSGEMDGGVADVEQGEDVVGGESGVLLRGPGAGRGGEVDGHDLMAGRSKR